jgi:hypothetical protein
MTGGTMDSDDDSDDSILEKNQFYALNDNEEDPENYSSFNARRKIPRKITPQCQQSQKQDLCTAAIGGHWTENKRTEEQPRRAKNN